MSNKIDFPIWTAIDVGTVKVKVEGAMYTKSMVLFGLIVVIFSGLLLSCSSSSADAPAVDMIKAGDKMGEMLFRNVVDESETRPLIFELCGDLRLADLSEEKMSECVVDYQPTIFLGGGLMEPNPDKLNEYWENLSWEYSINGRPVDLESFGTIDASGGRWWNILLENPTSDLLQIVTVLTVQEDPVEMLGNTLNLTVGGADEAGLQEDPILITSEADAGQHAYHSEKADLDYLLFVPEQYRTDPEQQWPLILYLHGAFSGTNVNHLRRKSLPAKLESESDFPFLVVSPHVLGEYEFWGQEETMEAVDQLLAEIEANLNVDPDRIYLTGESAGGYGTWTIGLHYPDRFAALVPAAGYYDFPFAVPENICDLKNIPVWAFHGAQDDVIPLDAEQVLVDALQECGGDAQFTVYPDAGHDIEELVYNTPDLFTWMLSQSSK